MRALSYPAQMIRRYHVQTCILAMCIMVAGADTASIPILGGCGRSLPAGQSAGSVSNVTILSGGVQRNYLISIPPTYSPYVPTPFILSYHGGLRTAEDQLQLDQLTNSEFNTLSFVVYPQGINNTWQGVPGVATDDVQFTKDILEELETRYCVNPSRISVTGKSDGAGFGNVLACDPILSKRVAAFAPVSGAYYIDTLPCSPFAVDIRCSSSRKDIPFLAFHGGNDTTIPFLGREQKQECLPAIPHFIQEWALRDGLSLTNTTTPVASSTVKYSYGMGVNEGLVELVFDSAIGHDWPCTEPNDDNQKQGHHPASFNATPIILDFFQRHSLSLLETIEEIF